MKLLKSALITLSLSASTALAYPHHTASGYVTNRFGQPLAGMSMCLSGPYNTQCSYTNVYGYYVIATPFAGTHLISAQGYGVYYSQYVFVNFNSIFNFVF